MPPTEVVIHVSAAFVFWNILNIIALNLNLPDKHLSREDFLDMRNRLVSIIHGMIGIILAGYHTYFLHNECG